MIHFFFQMIKPKLLLNNIEDLSNICKGIEDELILK